MENMGENRGREKQGEKAAGGEGRRREGKGGAKGRGINYSIKEIDNCKFKGTQTFH